VGRRANVEAIVSDYIQNHTPLYDYHEGQPVEVRRMWSVSRHSLKTVLVYTVVSLRYTNDSSGTFYPNAEWTFGLTSELGELIQAAGYTVAVNKVRDYTASLTVSG
jgi:hypothetical protein